MSSVNNVGHSAPVYSINRAGRLQAPAATPSTTTTRGADTVELSSAAQVSQMMETLKAGGDVRTDKVASIKAQIAAGTYMDDKKFDAAADKMIEDLLD